MYKTIFSMALMSIAAVTVAPASADDKPNDTLMEKLQGRWEIVAGVNQGQKLSKDEVDGTYMTVVTNEMVTFDRDARQRYRAVFRVDGSNRPAQITMSSVPSEPPKSKLPDNKDSAEAVSLGILKFNGKNEWTLCYALPGKERPKKFSSSAENRTMLFKMKKKVGDPTPATAAIE